MYIFCCLYYKFSEYANTSMVLLFIIVMQNYGCQPSYPVNQGTRSHVGYSTEEEEAEEEAEKHWRSTDHNHPSIPRIELPPSAPASEPTTPPAPPLTSPTSSQSDQDAVVGSLGASIRAGGPTLGGIAGIAAAAATQQGKPLNLTNLALAAQINARKRPTSRAQAAGARPQRALFCLSLRNPLRKMCIGIVEWKYVSRSF